MKRGVIGYSYNLLSWPAYIAGGVDIIVAPSLPASGNAGAANPAYLAQMTAAKNAGSTVLGYVETSYGQRAQASVQADIDRWYSFYPGVVDGIFFDEAQPYGDCASSKSYFQAVVAYARTKGASYNTLNCGTYVTAGISPPVSDSVSCLDGVAESIVTFEGGPAFYAMYPNPAWTATATSDIWHLLYASPCGNVSALITSAIVNKADILTITDDVLPNQWDDAATCWGTTAPAILAAAGGGGGGGGALLPVYASTLTNVSGGTSPGAVITWQAVVSNTGTGTGTTRIQSAIPAGVSSRSWTSTSAGGSSGAAASGTGAIDVNVIFQAGSSITFDISDTVEASATASTVITNSLNVTNGSPVSSSATAQVSVTACDVVNTMAAVSTSVAIGEVAVYNWTVSNSGPATVTGLVVSSALPSSAASRSWTSAQTGASGSSLSGSGAISEVLTIPAGGVVVYSIRDTVSTPAAADVSVSAVGTVVVPSTVTDSNAANNAAATASVPLRSNGAVVISKRANVTTIAPGGTLVYTLTVENTGAGSTVAVLTDIKPFDIESWAFGIAVVIAGTVTGYNTVSSSSASFTSTLTMSANSKITIPVTAVVKTNSTSTQLVNTLSATVSTGATPADSTSTVTIAGGPSTISPTNVIQAARVLEIKNPSTCPTRPVTITLRRTIEICAAHGCDVDIRHNILPSAGIIAADTIPYSETYTGPFGMGLSNQSGGTMCQTQSISWTGAFLIAAGETFTLSVETLLTGTSVESVNNKVSLGPLVASYVG